MQYLISVKLITIIIQHHFIHDSLHVYGGNEHGKVYELFKKH